MANIKSSDLRFSVKFDTTTGKIRFTDLLGTNNLYTGYDDITDVSKLSGYIKMYIDGVQIYAHAIFNSNNFTSPDITSTAWYKDLTFPTNANGSYRSGEYTFEYFLCLDNAAVTPSITVGIVRNSLYFNLYSGYSWINFDDNSGIIDKSIELEASRVAPYEGIPYPNPDIELTSDCSTSRLYYDNINIDDYMGVTPVVTHSWTVYYPNGSNVPSRSSTSKDGYIYPIWTGIMTATLDTTYTYNLETWGIYTWAILYYEGETSRSLTIECSDCICGVQTCLDNLKTAYENAIGLNGTSLANMRNAEYYAKVLLRVNTLLKQYDIAQRCGNDVSSYCSELNMIFQAESCTCAGDTTLPHEVTPYASGGGSVDYYISPIEFTSSLPSEGETGQTVVINSGANEGDIYYYESGAWSYKGNFKGAAGDAANVSIAGTGSVTFDTDSDDTLVPDDLATKDGVETFTNKTLTTPKIAIIHDTNGNEAVEFSATSSAINYIKFVNSATGDGVEIQAAGEDTDVDVVLTAKGSGGYKLGVNEIALDGDFETVNDVVLTAPEGGASITLPATGELATLEGMETLISKTLTSPTINDPTISSPIINGGVALTASSTELNYLTGVTGALATLAGEQTLTNKTLTAPIINGGDALTATSTNLNLLSGVTGTLVTLAGTQELENKTLTAPIINNGILGDPELSFTLDSQILIGATKQLEIIGEDESIASKVMICESKDYLGFFGVTPIEKPTLADSTLDALINTLVSLGLLNDAS